MMLLCDVGNTRIKWALASDRGRLEPAAALAHRGHHSVSAELERSLASLGRVERVVACSVASPDVNERLERCARDLWSLSPQWMPARRRGWGVQCAYSAPESMGADRWAMLVGARRRHPEGACVVSCGTAVTVDLLDGEGLHLGGVILPGISLMRRSLAENTALIAPSTGKVAAFPDNTPDAVATGAVLAAASTVDRLFAELRRASGPDVACILCGGDAEEVRGLMVRDAVVRHRLVLEGLAVMACEEP